MGMGAVSSVVGAACFVFSSLLPNFNVFASYGGGTSPSTRSVAAFPGSLNVGFQCSLDMVELR
ncbi:hypothetical protein BCR39DRAFT_537221 [Naematelia encephala]|uniref:Uncharacterized protein n=1 Tax=Naematelia encephala TaxID=71784 RepID=A0A1Y2AZR0_9TREE|nr:hypothetical protein BCR39DRAFT_537221 [Naematelia encephala]